MKITGSATMMPVSNIEAALRFYIDILGFEQKFRFDDYAGVQSGNCEIHLSQFGNPNTGAPGTGVVYIFADEIDEYYQVIVRRGAGTDAPPRDYPYGLRDFIARDPDGNQLTFGAPTHPRASAH